MRIFITMMIFVVLGCFVLPAFAAETPESVAVRVGDLEKANRVLQGDLGRAQLDIEKLRGEVRGLRTKLDEDITARKALEVKLDAEIASRKALETSLNAVKAALDAEIVARQAGEKTLTDADVALNDKITALQQALTDQATATANEIAALKCALDTERAERLAQQEKYDKMLAELKKKANQNRTMSILGIVLGGIGVIK